MSVVGGGSRPMLCVSGEFFLIFIVKCEKFVIVRRMCRFGARLCDAAGGRALQPDNIAHSGEEKKKIRSLRSEDVLVTPNFRENHRGRREGATTPFSG